jgi:hypothetical protein
LDALAATHSTAAAVLHELLRRGYTLDVRTRVEVVEYRQYGVQTITYADKLRVLGRERLTPELREAVREHRDELMAAACVLRPPVPWMRTLVARYLSGEADDVRRDGWRDEYRVRLAMVAANVAAFIGLHPAHDGPRLEPIIEETLREKLDRLRRLRKEGLV